MHVEDGNHESDRAEPMSTPATTGRPPRLGRAPAALKRIAPAPPKAVEPDPSNGDGTATPAGETVAAEQTAPRTSEPAAEAAERVIPTGSDATSPGASEPAQPIRASQPRFRARACQFLGLKGTPGTYHPLPDRANRCHLDGGHERVELGHQAAYCLSDQSSACPWLLNGRRPPESSDHQAVAVAMDRASEGAGWRRFPDTAFALINAAELKARANMARSVVSDGAVKVAGLVGAAARNHFRAVARDARRQWIEPLEAQSAEPVSPEDVASAVDVERPVAIKPRLCSRCLGLLREGVMVCHACGAPSPELVSWLDLKGTEPLRVGFKAIADHDEEEAYRQFVRATKETPRSLLAWEWRARLSPSLDGTIEALKRCYRLSGQSPEYARQLETVQQRKAEEDNVKRKQSEQERRARAAQARARHWQIQSTVYQVLATLGSVAAFLFAMIWGVRLLVAALDWPTLTAAAHNGAALETSVDGQAIALPLAGLGPLDGGILLALAVVLLNLRYAFALGSGEQWARWTAPLVGALDVWLMFAVVSPSPMRVIALGLAFVMVAGSIGFLRITGQVPSQLAGPRTSTI